jgi:hypothetical protein
MKKIMFLVASAVALNGAVQAQDRGKILIAYFSWGRNTREMAKQIKQQTDARPPLAAEVQNMAEYDTVFVSYPNW